MRRALLFALLAGVACRHIPRPLARGTDSCAECRMMITDTRYGGEVVLRTGKTLPFDASECLAGFVRSLSDRGEIRSIWVSDYTTGELVNVERARFVDQSRVSSPMGRNLIAVGVDGVDGLVKKIGGRVLTWDEVLTTRATAGPAQTHEHAQSPVASNTALAALIAAAPAGSRLTVPRGEYRPHGLVIDKALTLDGGAGAVLVGGDEADMIRVTADDVTITGFTFRGSGAGGVDERAAIRVSGAANCAISHNRIDGAQFGIYLAKTRDCVVADNEIDGPGLTEAHAGNGIHVWSSERPRIERNRVRAQRDGIYFEFVRGGVVRDNESTGAARYGLHFMFSDSCTYERNVFHRNGAGIAVMYSKRVAMRENRFADNWGGAAYGLLLKEISDGEIVRNTFSGNSVALYLEGSNRNRVTGNTFERNGWAVRLMGNADDNRFEENTFVENSIDVSTNTERTTSTFAGNFWDRYRGYDLDRDGVGDVPFAPMRLFAYLLEQSPSALILLRSAVVDALDVAERVVPALTPTGLLDAKPRMRPSGGSDG